MESFQQKSAEAQNRFETLLKSCMATASQFLCFQRSQWTLNKHLITAKREEIQQKTVEHEAELQNWTPAEIKSSHVNTMLSHPLTSSAFPILLFKPTTTYSLSSMFVFLFLQFSFSLPPLSSSHHPLCHPSHVLIQRLFMGWTNLLRTFLK